MPRLKLARKFETSESEIPLVFNGPCIKNIFVSLFIRNYLITLLVF